MENDNWERVGIVEYISKMDKCIFPQVKSMSLFLKFVGNAPFYLTEYGCEVVDTLREPRVVGNFSYNAESSSYFIHIPDNMPR